jgi:hypothetical protein
VEPFPHIYISFVVAVRGAELGIAYGAQGFGGEGGFSTLAREALAAARAATRPAKIKKAIISA